MGSEDNSSPKAVIVIDNKNGFFGRRSEGEGGGDSLEITYWILKDKSRLIAVNRSSWGMCCPESILRFFTFNDFIWKDVTKDVFPKLMISDFIDRKYLIKADRNKIAPVYISLPREGKDITVQLGGETGENGYHGKPIPLKNKEIKLIWNNENFIPK